MCHKQKVLSLWWKASHAAVTENGNHGEDHLFPLTTVLRARSEEHYTSITWRREVWKEEALDNLPLKGRERVVVSQTNIATVL